MAEFLAILAASSAVASWLQIALIWRQQRVQPPAQKRRRAR